MGKRILAAAAVVCAAVTLSAQPGQRQVSLVVANGVVVTMNAAGRVIENGAVAIDGSDIVGVDTSDAIQTQFRGRDTIDAAGHIVLPGLINTHTHAPMVLYRGLADDIALMDWLNKFIFPAEAKTVSPEFVRAGTRLAALEMIQSGTTTYADMYYFEEEIAKETKAAGLRGVLGQTIIQFPVPDAKTPADGLARAEAFVEAFKNDPLITPAVAPHALYTLDGPTLKAARDLSRRQTSTSTCGRCRTCSKKSPWSAGRPSLWVKTTSLVPTSRWKAPTSATTCGCGSSRRPPLGLAPAAMCTCSRAALRMRGESG